MTQPRVGFCGLGTMGAAMAANVARAGFGLTVWNRTPGRAEEPVSVGAVEAETPAAVAVASDIVIICVSDTPDVEAVLFAEQGLAAGLAPGALVIDCSTIAPAATREFGSRLAAGGVALVDAPVSGGSEGAQNGTLSIMVGGSEHDVERAMPVLAAMGASITHMGPLGSGQVTKAVNQVILSGVYLGVAEGLVLAMKSGLDARQVVEALAGGAAGSWVLQNRSGRMIDDETRSASGSRCTRRTWPSRWTRHARWARRCRSPRWRPRSRLPSWLVATGTTTTPPLPGPSVNGAGCDRRGHRARRCRHRRCRHRRPGDRPATARAQARPGCRRP